MRGALLWKKYYICCKLSRSITFFHLTSQPFSLHRFHVRTAINIQFRKTIDITNHVFATIITNFTIFSWCYQRNRSQPFEKSSTTYKNRSTRKRGNTTNSTDPSSSSCQSQSFHGEYGKQLFNAAYFIAELASQRRPDCFRQNVLWKTLFRRM